MPRRWLHIPGRDTEPLEDSVRRQYIPRATVPFAPHTQAALTCQQCARVYWVHKSRLSASRFCSYACFYASRRNRVQRMCQNCATPLLLKPSEIRKGGGKFCSRVCQSLYARIPAAATTRFWQKVDRTPGATACWLWAGSVFVRKDGRGGYGRFSLARRVMSASRASWIIHNGPIPDGLFVCHNCPGGDNRLCVRPSHLFLGTAKENSEDMVKKGRSASGDRNGSRTHPEAYAAARGS